MEVGDRILAAKELLGELYEQAPSSAHEDLLVLAFDALDFIDRAGHIREFEAYRKQCMGDHPSFVVAAFSTRAEADRWLQSVRYPPHSAYVLIADDYHLVMDFPQDRRRVLRPYPLTIELYLELLLEDGPPHVVASFGTLAEARAWFEHLDEKPTQAIVDIGDEWHLLAYHSNIDHLAVHPFSLVRVPKRGARATAE